MSPDKYHTFSGSTQNSKRSFYFINNTSSPITPLHPPTPLATASPKAPNFFPQTPTLTQQLSFNASSYTTTPSRTVSASSITRPVLSSDTTKISNKILVLLSLSIFLSVSNLYFMQPLLNIVGAEFEISESIMAIVTMSVQIGYAFGMLFISVLGDIISKKKLILALSTITCVSLIGVALSYNIIQMIVFQFLVGATTIIPHIAIPLAVDLTNPNERGGIVGILMSSLFVGLLGARVLSGIIANLLDWRAVYYFASASMFILLASIGQLIKNEPVLKQTCFIGSMVFATFSVLWTTLSFRLDAEPYNYSSGFIGLFGLIGMGGVFAAPILGRLSDRVSLSVMIVVSLIICAIGYTVLLLLDSHLLALIFGIFIIDMGIQSCHITNQSRNYRLSDSSRSRINACYMASYFIGGALGSGCAGFVYELWGWSGTSVVAICFLGIAMACHLSFQQDAHQQSSATNNDDTAESRGLTPLSSSIDRMHVDLSTNLYSELEETYTSSPSPPLHSNPFYRYKMKVLQAKVEGKGNGIKTVVVNLKDIARDLDRAPEYLTKFFEIEIGSQTNIEADRYSVNGAHSAETLAKILDSFIGRFVLCGSCRNPETKFIIKSKAMDLKCAACGAKTPLDIKSKMSGYIIKNPPKPSKSKGTTAAEAPAARNEVPAKDPTVKKSRRKVVDEDEDEDDDVVWHTDTSEASVEERKKKAIGSSTAVVMAMMDLNIDEQEEQPITDPVEYLVALLNKNVSDDEFNKELDGVKEKFSLPRSYDVARVAIEALGSKGAAEAISVVKNKRPLLAKIAAKKDGPYGVILGFEQLCVKDETLLKSILGIFKALYDEDIVGEEYFIKWYGKSKSKGIKKVAAPFIEWLENADEEDEDEEEEEEGEEEEEEGDEEEEEDE
eukprot:gene11232-13103_t